MQGMQATDKGLGVLYKLVTILSLWLLITGTAYGKTIDTWEGWCTQLLGKDHDAFWIGFDDKAIRADFIKKYNDFIVDKIAYKYLDGAKPTDVVVKELVRLKMIGVWNEGDNLYLSNELLMVDKEIGFDEFTEWAKRFRFYLDIVKNREQMDDFQYCIYGTINTHFENFILLGPDGRSLVIPLEFTRKKSFK